MVRWQAVVDLTRRPSTPGTVADRIEAQIAFAQTLPSLRLRRIDGATGSRSAQEVLR